MKLQNYKVATFSQHCISSRMFQGSHSSLYLLPLLFCLQSNALTHCAKDTNFIKNDGSIISICILVCIILYISMYSIQFSVLKCVRNNILVSSVIYEKETMECLRTYEKMYKNFNEVILEHTRIVYLVLQLYLQVSL